MAVLSVDFQAVIRKITLSGEALLGCLKQTTAQMSQIPDHFPFVGAMRRYCEDTAQCCIRTDKLLHHQLSWIHSLLYHHDQNVADTLEMHLHEITLSIMEFNETFSGMLRLLDSLVPPPNSVYDLLLPEFRRIMYALEKYRESLMEIRSWTEKDPLGVVSELVTFLSDDT